MTAGLDEIKLIEDNVAGLEGWLIQARKDKENFISAIGLSNQIEKEMVSLQEYREVESKLTSNIKDLKSKRNKALGTIAAAVADKLSEILPYGEGQFSASTEGQVSIGWKMDDGIFHPMESLSGGERVLFFSALANVFGANIIIQEAAEMDERHLISALTTMSQLEQQVIVNTWYPVPEASLPLAWKLVNIGGPEDEGSAGTTG